MYDNVMHLRVPSSEKIVYLAREQILAELDPTSYMYSWYMTKFWNGVNYSYCDLLYDRNSLELISLNGNNIIHEDLSIKILGRLYVMKSMRSLYPSIHQVITIPKAVETARAMGFKSLWYNFHRFDKRHERYSDSQKKLINGGQVPDQYMPYWKEFKFVGQHEWNGIQQDKFEFKL
jgi:hypothetical protein